MAWLWKNTHDAWGTIAKSFHWLIAALILGQFVIGKIAEASQLSPFKIDMFVWHKSIGVTILLLVVLRLAWRLQNSPPSPPAELSRRETKLAKIGHWILYGLMIVVPLSGWWVSDASRLPFKAYFVLPMPDMIAADRPTQEFAEGVHGILTKVLLVVAIGHIAAALRHHYRLRNDVLRRMLPGRR